MILCQTAAQFCKHRCQKAEANLDYDLHISLLFYKTEWRWVPQNANTSITKQRDYNTMVGTKKEIKTGAKGGDFLTWKCIFRLLPTERAYIQLQIKRTKLNPMFQTQKFIITNCVQQMRYCLQFYNMFLLSWKRTNPHKVYYTPFVLLTSVHVFKNMLCTNMTVYRERL